MEHSDTSWKIASAVAVILMLGAIAWGGWNASQNQILRSERDQEKLKVESLLAEKLLVEKNLRSIELQMEQIVNKNKALERKFGKRP